MVHIIKLVHIKILVFTLSNKEGLGEAAQIHRFARVFAMCICRIWMYSKTCLERPLSKRPKIGFQDKLSLNAGQKNCRMLQGEHSAILSTFIKLPYVFKTFVFSIFAKWSLKTVFTVHNKILILIALSSKEGLG